MSSNWKVEFIDKTNHVAEIWQRPDVRIIVDCRENFGDPEPWVDLITSGPTIRASLDLAVNALESVVTVDVDGRMGRQHLSAAIGRCREALGVLAVARTSGVASIKARDARSDSELPSTEGK